MNTCPFFGKCGGCKYDFTAPDYHAQKLREIKGIKKTASPVWIAPGTRRRAEFCFAGGRFGFFQPHSKDIIPIRECQNVVPAINAILPALAALPWNGAGGCLITVCDNGIDIAITANVPYFSPNFRDAASKLPAIRVTWNGRVIKEITKPMVSFDNRTVEYPTGAFLQPSLNGSDTLRNMVKLAANGSKHVADLFCGLGNFTFCLNADGFDITGTGMRRNLFSNPLTVAMLNQYDCVVMDPPRAGARQQCEQLAESDVGRVIYVSCNPVTFNRDMRILLNGKYKLTELIPIDQFAGSEHWELFSIFDK